MLSDVWTFYEQDFIAIYELETFLFFLHEKSFFKISLES